MSCVGVIRNPRSHRNQGGRAATPPGRDVLLAVPETPQDLSRTLERFAARGLGVLVIDGGDGTIREVLSRAPEAFGGRTPRLAILPSGKTNALAIDLTLPKRWSLEAALAAADSGKTKTRTPLEVVRAGASAPELRGFLFGTGAVVRATELAQRAHKAGAFGSPAVALTILEAVRRTLFGRARDGWRAGEPMTVDGQERQRFLMLAATLKRLPLGVRPFGTPREGLRLLDVDAPPSRLHAALPVVVSGKTAPWLEAHGYRREDRTSFDLALDGDFVLDGDIYPGGELTVREGAPLEFVMP